MVPLRVRAHGVELSGPASGVGAPGLRLGQSRTSARAWRIIDSQPGQSVTYRPDQPERGSDKKMTFAVRTDRSRRANVKITQSYDVDYGWDLLSRYAGLYVGRHVGDDMKLGLERLSNMLTTVPNVDYAATRA